MFTMTYLDQKTGKIGSSTVVAFCQKEAHDEAERLCKWAGWLLLSMGDL